MNEQDLHDYNKWLTEKWSKQWSNIPFMKDAPKAYLNYRKEQLRIGVVSNCKHYVKNWDAERCTYLCSGCGKDFTDSL